MSVSNAGITNTTVVTVPVQKGESVHQAQAEASIKIYQQKREDLRTNSAITDWERDIGEVKLALAELATLFSQLNLLMAEVDQGLGINTAVGSIKDMPVTLAKLPPAMDMYSDSIKKHEEKLIALEANDPNSKQVTELKDKINAEKKILGAIKNVFDGLNMKKAENNEDDENKQRNEASSKNQVKKTITTGGRRHKIWRQKGVGRAKNRPNAS